MNIDGIVVSNPSLSFPEKLMSPTKWGMHQIKNLTDELNAKHPLGKVVEVIGRLFKAVLGLVVAVITSPAFLAGKIFNPKKKVPNKAAIRHIFNRKSRASQTN